MSSLSRFVPAVPVTMSSREIAELTGKQHSNVMRDIRTMTDQLSADSNLNWRCDSETYTDEQGKPREMYRMDKDTTLTLVSGYDAVLRFRIIKRWQELENAIALPASPDLPLLESSLVLDFQGVPIRFLIDSHGEWMATYADVATALGYVNKEQQYNARNILKYTVKAGQRQLRHPLYGALINLAGLERVMAQFARNAACMPEPAALAENLKGWLDKTAKSLINQPVAASRLLESPKAHSLEIAPIDWEFTQAVQVFECWFTVLGDAVLTTRQVIDRAAGTPLAGLLLDIAEGRRSPGVVSSLRLGIWLARRVGWDFDGWVLPPVISRKNDVKRWTLRKVAP